MYRKGIFLVFILGFNTLLFSQGKGKIVNFKRIKKEIKRKRSDFYYPSLVKKFTRGLPMTLKEKRHLYYGFAFFNSYEPYKETKYYPKINKIIASKKYTKDNLNNLLNYVNLELATRPFDLKLLALKTFAYKRLHNKPQVSVVQKQVKVIKDAILSSGDGLSKESAYAVIFISNEYDTLQFLGLKEAKNSFVNKSLEYIKVQPNPKNIKGIYFNVNLITRRINSKTKK